MVRNIFIQRVLKQLEKFFIKKNHFQLDGSTYDLILFVPSDAFSIDAQYSLVISSKKFNEISHKDLIKELLGFLRESLDLDDYNIISRINVLHSHDSLVRNLKLITAYPGDMMELNDFLIGGVTINSGILVKSTILQKLTANTILFLEVRFDDSFRDRKKVGIRKISEDFKLICYSEEALMIMKNTALNIGLEPQDVNLSTASDKYLTDNNYLVEYDFDNILGAFSF